MKEESIIGIDLGGTNLRVGEVKGEQIVKTSATRINSSGTVEEVLQDIFMLTDNMIHRSVKAIGVGVPSVVDLAQGIVYDVQYIPSWKEVPLKSLLQERYGIPVFVNNDANCFALGELYFGKGKGRDSMIGLTIGTGLGSGIIIHKKLYAGVNCGAGEFGMVEYLDRCYEYYASGQFFQNVHGISGEAVFERAQKGDAKALKMYAEMGAHLGNAIKMVLYTYDTNLIVLGGSVRQAWPYFSKAMWAQIQTFAYGRSLKGLEIQVSELQNSGILGAASLYFDAEQ